MSLYRADDWIEELGFVGEVYVGRVCVYCDHPILEHHVFVVWRAHESSSDLVVHQPCAQLLGTHLIKDSFGVERTFGGQRARRYSPRSCCEDLALRGDCEHTSREE